jgi:hypothetical protein
MKDFALIVKMDALPEEKFSPEELQSRMQKWETWMDGIIAKDILVSRGNRLGSDHKTVKHGNVVINGPYAETKEIIGGFIVIRAESVDEAVEIVKSCPSVLDGWASIEVRNLFTGND